MTINCQHGLISETKYLQKYIENVISTHNNTQNSVKDKSTKVNTCKLKSFFYLQKQQYTVIYTKYLIKQLQTRHSKQIFFFIHARINDL